MEDERIVCKYCNSENVVKFGTFEGVQRYWCKDCKRKFVDNDALPKMKTPVPTIASALSCYYGGMPLDAIQRHLQQQHGVYLAESAIYNWVVRFSKDALDKVKDFKPQVGDTWIADETVIKAGGRNVWFHDIIDLDTRYLLASHISTSRTTQDAYELVKLASECAGKIPKVIITDKLASYIDGIERAFGADTKHIQSKPFVDINSTNVIERFHGTLKGRLKVIRSFRNMETAKLLTDAWLVYYNFFKEHQTLGNVPPAQKMGATPIKDWLDVIRPKTEAKAEAKEGTEEATIADIPDEPILQPIAKRKRRTFRRKPSSIRDKEYHSIRMGSLRLK